MNDPGHMRLRQGSGRATHPCCSSDDSDPEYQRGVASAPAAFASDIDFPPPNPTRPKKKREAMAHDVRVIDRI